mmetsp:Transcript_33878/g.40975  ORF Transcript_33878/g.40975 Transcript_33878/m.40975 type:complete len:81 (+) Transcript_33878:107-349(+)
MSGGVLRYAAQRLARPATRESMRPAAQQSRGFAADPHGPPKVNLWEDPANPSNWKEWQVVVSVLSGWGIVITGARSAFGK